MKLPNKIYDLLKWLIVIVIPAAATAILAYGKLFNWSVGETIAQCMQIAETFLGAVFCISAAEYNKTSSGGQQ
jgi:hypothetical protein